MREVSDVEDGELGWVPRGVMPGEFDRAFQFMAGL